MSIENHRERIDAIDQEIVALLVERAELAKKIGREKKKEGKEICDPEREEEVIKKVAGASDLDAGFVKKLFKSIIEYCKNEQD